MIYCISFVCFISLTAFGEKLQEQQNLQSIWKELEKLKEIDFLKERTRALELQNHYLNQKVETLERQCAEHSVEDVERTEKTDMSANMANNHSYSFDQTFESKKRTSKLNRRSSILPRQVSIQTHIAFTAGVSVLNLHNLGEHQAIIFDSVITNIGNAYHPHTGIFNVPVKGAYAITLTMTVEPNKLQWLELIVDGGSIYYISAGQADARNYASTTKQWILELQTGSEVWVRKRGTAHTDLNGYMNTIISGYLLFQT